MNPVRGNFRMYPWPEEYNVVSQEDTDLVIIEVKFKVRRRIYGGVTQKITEKLEGRVDGTFGS